MATSQQENAGVLHISTFAENMQRYPSPRYRNGRDKSAATEAFFLGLAGVGIFSWLLLSIEFFLAAEFAFWVVAALVFLAGTEAFWGGMDILREGMPGRFLAVMAVILGVITIIPPAEWLLMAIEAVLEGALNRFDRFLSRLILGKNYARYYQTRRTVHIRRPYYQWFKTRFN